MNINHNDDDEGRKRKHFLFLHAKMHKMDVVDVNSISISIFNIFSDIFQRETEQETGNISNQIREKNSFPDTPSGSTCSSFFFFLFFFFVFGDWEKKREGKENEFRPE